MLIKIETDSPTIDIIIEEVAGNKPEGLTLQEWGQVLQMCQYLHIPCMYLIRQVNERIKQVTPNFSGLKFLSLETRKQCLSSLDKHLGTNHQADLDQLFLKIEQRFINEATTSSQLTQKI